MQSSASLFLAIFQLLMSQLHDGTQQSRLTDLIEIIIFLLSCLNKHLTFFSHPDVIEKLAGKAAADHIETKDQHVIVDCPFIGGDTVGSSSERRW